MVTFFRFSSKPACILACALALCVGCNDDDKKGGTSSKESLALTSFHPNYGKYQEKVILQGKGFGDPSQMRVYFNQRKAPVIGVSRDGTELYVQAPRLPGDTCVISVSNGKDSLSYEETFAYTVSTTVTTVCGNGTGIYKAGDLSEAQVSPYYCCVDSSENVFVIDHSSSNGDGGSVNGIARIDFKTNELVTISTQYYANVPCVDPVTQKVMAPTETTVGMFVEMDPKEMWGLRVRDFGAKIDWSKSSVGRPANGYKHTFVVNPYDGFIYTRFYYGQVVKINPVTYEAEVVCDTPNGDSFGLTFRPTDPNVLYVACWSNMTGMANSIAKVDLNKDKPEMEKLTSGITGHRDGKIAEARFNCPAQLFSDNDGNIYVADCDNHCIRRITPENQVETVLGVPGKSGWKDGTKEEALFKYPRGIGISKDGSVYVADFGNRRVRKLSIN